MAKLKALIEHLERVEGGWYLRYRASTSTFQRELQQFEALIAYPDRIWEPYALDGKGAWFIAEEALEETADFFSNYKVERMKAEERWEKEGQFQSTANAQRQELVAQLEAKWRWEREELDRKYSEAISLLPETPQQAFALLRLPETASKRQVQENYRRIASQYQITSHLMAALNIAYRMALQYIADQQQFVSVEALEEFRGTGLKLLTSLDASDRGLGT